MHEDILARLPLFQNLDEESRAQLEAAMVRVHVQRGHEVFHVGDPAEELYILANGKVKLTRPSRQLPAAPTSSTRRLRATVRPTRESLLWIIGPAEMFGELSIFDPGTRSTSAVAMLDCDLYRISRDDLLRIVNDRHDVALAMLKQLASRLRRANDTTSGLIMSDVPGRLAYLLLSLASRFGTETDRGIEVHHDLTQAEIAQMVGASRETVNKILTDFVARKWISMQAGSTLIKDPARLRARMD